MTAQETSAVESLKLNVSDGEANPTAGGQMSNYDRIRAKKRRMGETKTSYLDVKFIPETYCAVERVFSMAGWVLTVLRKSMSPILFHCILFIKVNR